MSGSYPYHSFDDPSYITLQVTSLVEMFLYGSYVIIFYRCVLILNTIRRDKGTSHSTTYTTQTTYLYGTLITFFLIASLNTAATVFCNLKQFYIGTHENMPVLFYEPILLGSLPMVYPWVYTLKNILFVIAILISDAFLVFRCYVVWGRRLKAAAFPLVAFVADIAIGCLFLSDTVYEARWDSIDLHSETYQTLRYTFIASRVALFSVTLSLNIICTFLIAFQIWKIQKQIRQKNAQGGYVRNAVVTIIESGVIYSAWMIAILAEWLLSMWFPSPSYVYMFFQDTAVQIIAITFSIIISRISRGASTGDNRTQDRHTRQSAVCLRSRSFVGPTPINGFGKSASSQPVQIMIGRDVWHNDDTELGSHEHPSLYASIISTHDSSIKSGPENPVIDTNVV